MNQTQERIPVPANVLDGVLQYLATRPYKEVAQGISLLQQAVQQHQQEPQPAPDRDLSPAEERAVNGLLADKE